MLGLGPLREVLDAREAVVGRKQIEPPIRYNQGRISDTRPVNALTQQIAKPEEVWTPHKANLNEALPNLDTMLDQAGRQL